MKKTHDLVTIQNLIDQNLISLSTGDEIGKMAYGTGDIPFIRTSDMSNWELKIDPKQGVSEDIYNEYKTRQDVKPEDIFLVRDGTYLVGTSCILSKEDEKILFCGGIYKIRIINKKKINPYLLFGLLNMNIKKRQLKSKQFTRDVIDTLGHRFSEVIIPIPKDYLIQKKVAGQIQNLIWQKQKLREEQKSIRNYIQFLKN